MQWLTISKLLGATLFAVTVGACGGASQSVGDESGDEGGNEVSVDEALQAHITPGSFRLYAKAHTVPNPDCDMFTQLDLKSTRYSTATLESRVSGGCEIAPTADKRTFRLKSAGTECGSTIYTGSIKKKDGNRDIKITDHRERVCEDPIAALIVVTETAPDGRTYTTYSNDAADPPIWPADGNLIIAKSQSASFTPTAAAGADCAYGGHTYALDIAKKLISWEVCEFKDWKTPLKKVTGKVTASPIKVNKITSAMKSLRRSQTNTCGADKLSLSVTVDSKSQGIQVFNDSFYACEGQGPYVDGIDAVFEAFRDIVSE